MLAGLEGQLHVLGGLDLGDGALHVEPLGVVGGVGLVGLGLHLAVDDELVVVEVARVAGHAVVAAHVLGPQALLAGHEGLEELLAVAGADDWVPTRPKTSCTASARSPMVDAGASG